MRDTVADQAAHRMLRRAYEADYRLTPDFEGFRASVYYAWDRESWVGSVEVHSTSGISYGGAIEDADGQLRWEVASLVKQCWGAPCE